MKPSAMRPSPEITIRATPVTPQPMIAATALEVPAGDAKAGYGDDRSDDVAAPVDDIEDGALDRGRLLALNGLAELRACSEVLSPGREGRHEIAKEHEAQSNFQRDVQPVDLRRAVENECGGCSGRRCAPPEGQAVLIRFLSWTRSALGIRVERENACESEIPSNCRVNTHQQTF